MYTPFHGQFLRDFRGPDGARFLSFHVGEARLAFALCIDFFATEGMNVRGPSTSLGIIVLVCLNLPTREFYWAVGGGLFLWYGPDVLMWVCDTCVSLLAPGLHHRGRPV